MALKIGDVVRLKSGGPKMTVTGRRDSINDGEGLWCSWIYQGKKEEFAFPSDALVKVRERRRS